MGFITHNINEILNNLLYQKEIFHKVASDGPPGSLHIRNYKGNRQFVHSIPVTGEQGKHIRRSISKEPETLQSLFLKQYAEVALDLINRNDHLINKAASGVIDIVPENILERMPKQYRAIPPDKVNSALNRLNGVALDLSSATLSPEYLRIASEWAEEPFEQSDYKPHERNIETSRGLFVRSKSEAVVCEKLYEYGVPFRYENVIHIGMNTLAPDFTFLDANRDNFYLEYCGMMDIPKYVDQYLWKRDKYESIGIYQWKNMIYVFEKNNLISVREIELIIQNVIIPRLVR